MYAADWIKGDSVFDTRHICLHYSDQSLMKHTQCMGENICP